MKSRFRMRGKAPFRRVPWRGVLAIALFALAAIAAALLEPAPLELNGQVSVADGDTLRMGRERIRLTGLDAPEIGQTCTDADGASWKCGEMSRRRLEEIVAGSEVRCTTQGRDRYGRYLGRCTVHSRDIGALLVAEGLALADAPSYASEDARARRERRGIWAGRFDTPRKWRDTHGETAVGFDLFGWIRSWFD